MPKKKPKGIVPKWTDVLNKDEVREAFKEAIVDAYGDAEQHTGLLTMIQDEVKFPFKARVLGEVLKVVGVEWPEDDEYGLDFVVERGGERHRVEARSVDLVPPLPKGHLYIAAYLEWKRNV